MAETPAPPRYISCDPALYDGGGFVDDPAILERIRAEHERAPPEITTEAVLYGPASYPRPVRRERIGADAPTWAAVEAAFVRVTQQFPVAPPCLLVRVRDGRILDRAVYQMRDGVARPLYETHRAGDRPYFEWTDAAGPAEELPDNQDYLLLSSIGTFNWGHWLSDDLARLKGILHLAARGRRRLCVLVHAYYASIDAARLDSLKALVDPALSVHFRLIFPNRTYQARTLHVVSPVSIHPGLKHPAALADLAEAGREKLVGAPGLWRRPKARPARIFVTRRPRWGRVPVNLEAVHALVSRRGFAVIDTEGASGAEQMAPFVAADRVVGCMGAAMGGSLFSPPGTKLLYLAPDTFDDPYYWDQAAARGQDYGVLFGPALDRGDPAKSDYRIDLAELDRALDALD